MIKLNVHAVYANFLLSINETEKSIFDVKKCIGSIIYIGDSFDEYEIVKNGVPVNGNLPIYTVLFDGDDIDFNLVNNSVE